MKLFLIFLALLLMVSGADAKYSPALEMGGKIDMNGYNITELKNGTAAQDAVTFSQIQDGWIPSDETWYYSSADDPTYAFNVSSDKTSKYQAGDRIKLTQPTVKYFIVTNTSYSSPNTTITMYGGTDYDLANAAITSPYYSKSKSPQGFPQSPAKWSVVVSDASDVTQNPATANQYYNLGSIQIDIPPGLWYVRYKAYAYEYLASQTSANIAVALSTSNNTLSNKNLMVRGAIAGATATMEIDINAEASTMLDLEAETTYYLIAASSKANSAIGFSGAAQYPTTIEAVCVYL